MSIASVTNVSICNIAISKVGGKRITALSDDTPAAILCNDIFEETRNSVLCDHIWSFAQKRVALVDSGIDPVYEDDLVTIAYTRPTDLLKVNFTNIRSALVKLEGQYILSDTASLYIKYTFEQTDTTLYFPKFVMALATKIAAEIAYPITTSRSVAKDLHELYLGRDLPSAIAQDSQQGTPLPPMQDEWIDARRMGSGELVGQSGYSIWYPC